MILNLWDTLNNMVKEVNKFIMNNYDNYFFWIGLFAILFIIAVVAVSKLTDK